MRIALSLWFDEKLEESIRQLWNRLHSEGIASPLYDGRYRPHLTMGLWNVADVPALAIELTGLLGTILPFPMRFESVGLFPGEEGTVLLAPIVTAQLLDIHKRIYELSLRHGEVASPYYKPDGWVPHCTAAWKVTPAEVLRAAQLLLANAAFPLSGMVAQLGVVQTPEEVELHRIGLR